MPSSSKKEKSTKQCKVKEREFGEFNYKISSDQIKTNSKSKQKINWRRSFVGTLRLFVSMRNTETSSLTCRGTDRSFVCVRHYCSSRELPVLFCWRVKNSLYSEKVRYSTYVSQGETDLGQGSHLIFFLRSEGKAQHKCKCNPRHCTLYVTDDLARLSQWRWRLGQTWAGVFNAPSVRVYIFEERSSQRSSSSKSVFWVHLNRTLRSKLILGTDAAGKTIAL